MKNLNAGYILKKEVPNIETVKLQRDPICTPEWEG